MVATISVKKEVDIKQLFVHAQPRYWEDATVNGTEDTEGDLIPCKNGNMWEPIIDIETGKIINWTTGIKAKIHYKVCDCGIYILIDSENNEVARLDGYVPGTMCPDGNGYGDYIIMTIDENGIIANWKFNLSEFIEN